MSREYSAERLLVSPAKARLIAAGRISQVMSRFVSIEYRFALAVAALASSPRGRVEASVRLGPTWSRILLESTCGSLPGQPESDGGATVHQAKLQIRKAGCQRNKTKRITRPWRRWRGRDAWYVCVRVFRQEKPIRPVECVALSPGKALADVKQFKTFRTLKCLENPNEECDTSRVPLSSFQPAHREEGDCR
jgi:hypothetical protein